MPEVKPVQVKSAAEYLKEFSEFYSEAVEIKVEVEEETKHEGKFEEQEEFEEEVVEEEEVEEEEFENEESARQAAPHVRPAFAPPDPLELCEDLDNAVYDAEQRIGKLERMNEVNESRIAGLEEHIGKLKEAAEARFEEQEERLAAMSKQLVAALATISALQQVTPYLSPPASPPPSPPPNPPPPPSSPSLASLPITPPTTPVPRRQYPTPAPTLAMELQAATLALADLQVIVRRCSSAVRRPPAPCRHHLAQKCWYGAGGQGCRFRHGDFSSGAAWRSAPLPPPSSPSPASPTTATPAAAPRTTAASPKTPAKCHSEPHPPEPCYTVSPRVAASPKTRERLKDTLEELAGSVLDATATIKQINAK